MSLSPLEIVGIAVAIAFFAPFGYVLSWLLIAVAADLLR